MQEEEALITAPWAVALVIASIPLLLTLVYAAMARAAPRLANSRVIMRLYGHDE